MELKGEKKDFREGSLLLVREFHTLLVRMEFVRHLLAVRGWFSFSRFGISKIMGQVSLIPEQQIYILLRKYLVNLLQRTLSRVYLWCKRHTCAPSAGTAGDVFPLEE